MRGASDLNAREIVQDYQTLCNLKKVARKHHTSAATVRSLLAANGVEILRRFTPERLERQRAWQQSPEYRAKQRTLWIEQYRRQAREKPVHTYIERQLHDALGLAELSFETQERVGDWLVDIRLLDFPVLIEADGHTHLLATKREQDRRRDAETAAAGYVTFRFTGKEIRADAAACISLVRGYIADAVASGVWELPAPHEPIARLNDRRGPRAPMYGRKMTPEQIEKSASKRRGRPVSEERREAIRQALTGRTLPAETREKVSRALTGRAIPPEVREKMAAARRAYYAAHPPQPLTAQQRQRIRDGIAESDYRRTPEHSAKLAQARRGRQHTEATKERISAAKRGRPLSPEHKALISAKVREAWERKQLGQSDEDIVRPGGRPSERGGNDLAHP